MPAHYQAPQTWTGRTDPEDGPLAQRIYSYVVETGTCAVIGFASEAGVARNKGRVGAKLAPDAIRTSMAGLSAPENFPTFTDLGNIIVDDDALEDGQTLLGEHLAKALASHRRVIVFGGGHETAYGTYLGLNAVYPDKKIGIINLDAHLDLRNIGSSGPSSGTPFNQIRSLNPERFDYLCVGVAKESNTQALFERAKDWGVRIVYDDALAQHPNAADSEITAMCKRCDVIYLTIDIDVLPHYQAPGVSAPAARGVTFTTIEHIVQTTLDAAQEHSCSLPVADLVEVSPPFDKDNMTAKSAAILAARIMRSGL